MCGVKRGTDEHADVTDPTATATFSVWRVSVTERARGGGVGRKLMTAAEDWAREQGGTKMQLYTGNPVASLFYRKLGYAKVSSFAHTKQL